MLGVVVLGTALVAFSWNARDAEALSPSFQDHWHLPYGIYDCTIDGFQGALADPGFATHAGIHTHSDSVVHLHPFSSVATGNNATLSVFLDATTAQFDGDEALTFSDRPELASGVQCDGEDAVLQLASFDAGATEPTEVITEDLADFRFRADQQGFVIALAPLGADIPPPPQDAIDSARASSPNIFSGLDIEGVEDGVFDSAGIGFDEDGNLVDANEEPIINPDTGEPVTLESIQEANVDPSPSDDGADG